MAHVGTMSIALYPAEAVGCQPSMAAKLQVKLLFTVLAIEGTAYWCSLLAHMGIEPAALMFGACTLTK